jgi:hypothetical protein
LPPQDISLPQLFGVAAARPYAPLAVVDHVVFFLKKYRPGLLL